MNDIIYIKDNNINEIIYYLDKLTEHKIFIFNNPLEKYTFIHNIKQYKPNFIQLHDNNKIIFFNSIKCVKSNVWWTFDAFINDKIKRYEYNPYHTIYWNEEGEIYKI